MGAPNVSSAIFTMSTARTTPAQKPRGLSKRTRLVPAELSAELLTVGSTVAVVTSSSIPRYPVFEPFLNHAWCNVAHLLFHVYLTEIKEGMLLISAFPLPLTEQLQISAAKHDLCSHYEDSRMRLSSYPSHPHRTHCKSLNLRGPCRNNWYVCISWYRP